MRVSWMLYAICGFLTVGSGCKTEDSPADPDAGDADLDSFDGGDADVDRADGDLSDGDVADGDPPDGEPPPSCGEPNPIRVTDIPAELHELVEVLADGSFEGGTTEIRARESPRNPDLDLARMEISPLAARTGERGFLVEAGPGEAGELTVRALTDKGKESRYSMWVRSPAGPTVVRGVLSYENAAGRTVTDVVLGPEVTVGREWTEVALSDYATANFDWAQFGLSVMPNTTLHIDDFSVQVPLWRLPVLEGEIRTVGGIEVPATSVAPFLFTILIHIEDPQELLSDELYFRRKSIIFRELSRVVAEHGGILTIQPELEWADGAERFMPGLLGQLATDYGVVYSTHTHGPACLDPEGTPFGNNACAEHRDWSRELNDEDVVRYVSDRALAFGDASGTPVTDHNGQWTWDSFWLLEGAGMATLSAFKDGRVQRSFDTLITNPWRPSQVPANDEPEAYFVHDPAGPLIYVPGVGHTVSKYDDRLLDEAGRFAAQFLARADADRVNTFYLVTHVDHFYSLDGLTPFEYIHYDPDTELETLSDEFLRHLAFWDDLLETLIDPLVAEGYVRWASLPQMGEAFIRWEDQCRR